MHELRVDLEPLGLALGHVTPQVLHRLLLVHAALVLGAAERVHRAERRGELHRLAGAPHRSAAGKVGRAVKRRAIPERGHAHAAVLVGGVGERAADGLVEAP